MATGREVLAAKDSEGQLWSAPVRATVLHKGLAGFRAGNKPGVPINGQLGIDQLPEIKRTVNVVFPLAATGAGDLRVTG